MRLFRSVLLAFLSAAPASLLVAPSALAQNPLQNGRFVVASPTVLGMGDAGVAFPTRGGSYFYNPAHVAYTAGLKPQITVGHVQLRGSQNLQDYVNFFNDDLEPALDRGIENLSAAEKDTLYDRAVRLTRDRAFASVDATPLAVAMRVGPVALGVGAFGSTGGRFRTVPGTSPKIEAAATVDLSVVTSGAVNLTPFGVTGLTVGANAKYLSRKVVIKEKPIDAFSSNEEAYLYEGSGIGLDLGALYEVPLPLPGRLAVGATFYDAVGGGITYDYEGRSIAPGFPPYADSDQRPSASLQAQEDSLAQLRFGIEPSYRMGVSYTVPSLFGVFAESGIAVDYVGYTNPQISDQPFLAHLSLGAQVQVVRMLALRAGLNQGYLSAGAGVKLGPLALDYAYHGFEQGVNPGDAPSYQHLGSLKLVF